MKFKFSITLFISCQFCSAQEKFDYQWMVGYPPYGGDSSLYGACMMNFNNDSLKLIKVPKATLVTILSTASICNKTGELALYTNGCEIHNGNFELVEGCGNINPGIVWNAYCPNASIPSYPTIQSQIFLPVPEKENQFLYMAHREEFSDKYNWSEFNYYTEFYQCNIIDMALKNGKGKSIDNFIIEYPEVVKGSNLAACKHANGKDWWIINFSFNTEKFYRLLLTNNGISGPWEQINGPPRDSFESLGQCAFSPDGKKYACIYSLGAKAWVLDFDRKTGLFSNLKILEFDTKNDWNFRGVAFSPNSKYLYIAADYFLYQYDTNASDIQNSKILIDTNDGYALPGWPFYISFGIEQLGPDGKIYIGQLSGGIRQWSVINKPDEKGIACEFKQHSLTFPVYSNATPPIQPHFRLGPDSTSTTFQFPKHTEEMKCWYNAASKFIKCWIQHLANNKNSYELLVNDINGRTLISHKINDPQYQEDISLDGSDLVHGVYVVNLMVQGRVVAYGKVMVY